VFLAALEIEDEAGRRAFLDEELGIDTGCRREVERLLGVHEAGLPLSEQNLECQKLPNSTRAVLAINKHP
jgi:hypothetical protein